MKKVLLITSRFPYGTGEQFLETETAYYQEVVLTLMPKGREEGKRDLPEHITLDTFLVENSFKRKKLTYLLMALRHKVLYRELFSENFFNLKKLKLFLGSLYLYEMYYELFDSYFRENPPADDLTVYTYWNDETTYALQSLKAKFGYKLVSRIHGGDLYLERRPFHYMPLKKHFNHHIETLYTITDQANGYLVKHYGFNPERLRLSRLGVEERKIITPCSPKGHLSVVSCSFLTEVKQVHKIIEALKEAAKGLSHLTIHCTHIGGGVLYERLELLAKEHFKEMDNISYELTGDLDNREVYAFYTDNAIDLFINTSRSEGVPVSIMEAMSCHIPVIAPDVGGISDMLTDGYNGHLLSPDPSIEEIATALRDVDFYKKADTRIHSYELFLKKYNAKDNYTEFVQNI